VKIEPNLKGKTMKAWQCIVCGYVYDEAKGDPEHGIAPGTRWEDVPEGWECPDCGVAKADFEMVEVTAA
jgi:rubredoxin